jgi:hypothetical protein
MTREVFFFTFLAVVPFASQISLSCTSIVLQADRFKKSEPRKRLERQAGLNWPRLSESRAFLNETGNRRRT